MTPGYLAMRLTVRERRIIVDAVAQHFGRGAIVRLFGSRVDDTARGGDIDLYLATVSGSACDIVRRKLALLADLHEQLGEQRIDVVVQRAGGPDLLVHRVAQSTGIPLS